MAVRLSDADIRAAEPREHLYTLTDGHGLALFVLPTGAKYWRFRYRFEYRAKMLSFGTYPDTPLGTARERLADAQELLARGIDPSAYRRAERTARKSTFESVARQWLQVGENRLLKKAITPKTYRKQVSILNNYLIPAIGSRPVRSLTPQELLVCLKKLELRGLDDTAHCARRICSHIFQFSIGQGYASFNIADQLRGLLEPLHHGHYPAITDPARFGTLLRAIDASAKNPAYYALQLLPLLFVRPGELSASEWREFDFEHALWRIPACRMKMGTEHIVPLSRQVLQLLESLRALSRGGPYLFPSARSRTGTSTLDLAKTLARLGFPSTEVTRHGFRTKASTLLNELGWNPDAIEVQLAHAIPGRIRRIYNRAKYLDVRRWMMQGWADYLDSLRCLPSRGPPSAPSNNVASQDVESHSATKMAPTINIPAFIPSQRRQSNKYLALTAKAVKGAKPQAHLYKLWDGRGLFLLVRPVGPKLWRFRYVFGGHDTTVSLGRYPQVSLRQARMRSAAARAMVSSSVKPVAKRLSTSNTATAHTFQHVARHWLSKLARRARRQQRSMKTFRKAKSMLTRFVFPKLGHRPIQSITVQDVLRIPKEIEASGRNETAHRVLLSTPIEI